MLESSLLGLSSTSSPQLGHFIQRGLGRFEFDSHEYLQSKQVTFRMVILQQSSIYYYCYYKAK